MNFLDILLGLNIKQENNHNPFATTKNINKNISSFENILNEMFLKEDKNIKFDSFLKTKDKNFIKKPQIIFSKKENINFYKKNIKSDKQNSFIIFPNIKTKKINKFSILNKNIEKRINSEIALNFFEKKYIQKKEHFEKNQKLSDKNLKILDNISHNINNLEIQKISKNIEINSKTKKDKTVVHSKKNKSFNKLSILENRQTNLNTNTNLTNEIKVKYYINDSVKNINNENVKITKNKKIIENIKAEDKKSKINNLTKNSFIEIKKVITTSSKIDNKSTHKNLAEKNYEDRNIINFKDLDKLENHQKIEINYKNSKKTINRNLKEDFKKEISKINIQKTEKYKNIDETKYDLINDERVVNYNNIETVKDKKNIQKEIKEDIEIEVLNSDNNIEELNKNTHNNNNFSSNEHNEQNANDLQNFKDQFDEKNFKDINNKNSFSFRLNDLIVNATIKSRFLTLNLSTNNSILLVNGLENEIRNILKESGYKNFNLVIKDKEKRVYIDSSKNLVKNKRVQSKIDVLA
ncbi:hypothetical protein [Nitrosophilus kaiyonis]|uniref:hypothetical protein n=1 Tax=Nitrosophilus kaiyonis TaxID=2930200 RepID=UPI00248F4FA8|nr:hypothetical protein [Nitrosophilus kaiyonis]